MGMVALPHVGRTNQSLGPNFIAVWPIGYEDIKPYYDKIDRQLGVFGTNEGLENDPDGIFLPPPKPRLHELFIKKAANSVVIPFIPSRLSILTKNINKER